MMNRGQQKGFNLVELMVGLVISLIVLGGAIYVFVGNSESNIFQMRSTRFIQQMRDVMDRMVNDIRRAGYEGYKYYALEATVQIPNPFDYDTALPPPASVLAMGIKTSLNIDKRSGEANDSCVTYAYNLDDDYPVRVDLGSTSFPSGTTPSGSNLFGTDGNELFGFQLRTDSDSSRPDGKLGSVWMRTGGGASTFNCDSGNWVRVTDPNLVDIDTLSFSLNNTQCLNMTDTTRNDCYSSVTPGSTGDDPVAGDLLVVVREVHITMTGSSVDDSDLTFSLDQVVDLPNDRSIEVQ